LLINNLQLIKTIIYKEMKLEKLPKGTGLKVPESDYFNKLPTQIQNRVQGKTKNTWLGLGVQQWAYACSFLIAATIWGMSGQFSKQTKEEESLISSIESSEMLENISDEFLDDYLLESDISTEELFATLHEGESQSEIVQDLKNEILEGLEEEDIIDDIDEYLVN
jgi:hypothetical protein